MYQFLREKGIKEDILERMEKEKITMETVTRLGPNNQELSQFLCLGDRTELLEFCTQKSKFDPSDKSKLCPSEKSKKKRRLYESIKRKMMLNKPNGSSEESDEEFEIKKKHKMIGNQNAKKASRIIEFGWYHNGSNVRGRLGGGTRKITVLKAATKDDLLEEAKNLYFPNGISRRNVKVADCTFCLRDFMHNPLDDDMTVGKLSDSVKMTGRLRFYMYSTGPSTIDSEKCNEAILPAEATTSTSGVETSFPQITLLKHNCIRKLPDFPTTTVTNTDSTVETITPPKSTDCIPCTHESISTPSQTLENVLNNYGNYWPPDNIDSEIIFGRDLMATENLSETIPYLPIETRDISSHHSDAVQQSTSLDLPVKLLHHSTPLHSPRNNHEPTPLHTLEYDLLNSKHSPGLQYSLPSPILESQYEPHSETPSTLPEPKSPNTPIPTDPVPADLLILPEPQSVAILPQPKLVNPPIPPEPVSADLSILSEPQSANESILPQPKLANPPVSTEPASADLSILSHLQSANSPIPPELRSQTPPRSPTPPRMAERNIRIRRTMLQADMITNFKDPAVIEETVTFTFVDERGVDVQGVSRDAYTCFWEYFVSSSTKGEEERVPSIMPKFQKEDWIAIGRILVKGFCEHGIFPIQISRAFFVAMLYGEREVTNDLLLESFQKYVTNPERIVIQKALQGVLEEDDDKEEFHDLLGRMDCSIIPTSNTKAIIMQVAHTELIQQGKYALDAIASVAKESLVANLPTPDCLLGIYKSKEPSYRKIIKLLSVEPSNPQENNILNYLKQLIRGFTPDLLVRFLHFVTGARVICVDKIEIAFNKTVGLGRVPIARTCGPVLELSVSYSSFTEFRQEFLNVLSSHSSQRFDID